MFRWISDEYGYRRLCNGFGSVVEADEEGKG